MEPEIRLVQEVTALTEAGQISWQIAGQESGPPVSMTLMADMPTATGPVHLKLVAILFAPQGRVKSPDHPVANRFTLSVDDPQGTTSFTIRGERTDSEEALFDLYLVARRVAEQNKISSSTQAEALLKRLRTVPQQ